MREYLFRAKTIKQNKGVTTEKPIKENMWVYGNLTVGKIEGYKADMISNKKEIYYINSNTVGQFTGLTDKNGTKIFEGDIVKDEQAQMLGKVVYATAADGFDGMAGFMVDDIDDGLQNYNGFWHLVEVTGNIDDNPELLESEVQGNDT